MISTEFILCLFFASIALYLGLIAHNFNLQLTDLENKLKNLNDLASLKNLKMI